MTEKPCKILKLDLTTYKNFHWEVGRPVKTNGEGDLCGPGWLHYYRHPLLAVLHNPLYGNFGGPYLLYSVTAGGKLRHDGWLKSGCTELTLIEPIAIPQITTEQMIRYAIGCARKVYSVPDWLVWANRWLQRSNRSPDAAEKAEMAVCKIVYAATSAAKEAASAAACATSAAKKAASAAKIGVDAAAYATYMRYAAEEAVCAADAASRAAAVELPLLEIAEWACSLQA